MTTQERLKALTEWGMNRTAISRFTGISKPTISRLLSGKHKGANESNGEKIRILYEEKCK